MPALEGLYHRLSAVSGMDSFQHAAIVIDHLEIRMDDPDLRVLLENPELDFQLLWQPYVIAVQQSHEFTLGRFDPSIPGAGRSAMFHLNSCDADRFL